MIKLVKFKFLYWFNRLWLFLFAPFLVRTAGVRLEKIGSSYGGWVLPVDLIQNDWICYCAGVGEDITFDLELIERWQCQVYSFDPTPRAISYIEKQKSHLPAKFQFYAFGLWSADGVVKFYAPRNPRNVSHSIVNLRQTEAYFSGAVKTVSSVMKQLGHRKIDLLKLDIEGAEHAVLENLGQAQIFPTTLCIEYDQPITPMRLFKAIKYLQNAGYLLVNIDRFNFTFLLQSQLLTLV